MYLWPHIVKIIKLRRMEEDETRSTQGGLKIYRLKKFRSDNLKVNRPGVSVEGTLLTEVLRNTTEMYQLQNQR